MFNLERQDTQPTLWGGRMRNAGHLLADGWHGKADDPRCIKPVRIEWGCLIGIGGGRVQLQPTFE